MRKKAARILIVAALFAAIFAVGAYAEKQVGAGEVNTDALNFRAEPSTDAKVLAVAYKGDKVLVVSDTEVTVPDGWVYAEYNYTQGYMSAQYLDVSNVKDADFGSGKVTGSVVNVRTKPSTGGDVLLQLKQNVSVKVMGVDSGWFKVKYGEKEGYMHPDYLTLAKPASTSSSSSSSSGNVASAAPISPAGAASGAAVVDYAKQLLGIRYISGGASLNGFDCSGMTYYVYKQFGKTIKRGATSQLSNGTAVDRGSLEPGDLVFFRDTTIKKTGASHVGIYVGNNSFIHSNRPGGNVRITSLDDNYYRKYYLTARRIFT